MRNISITKKFHYEKALNYLCRQKAKYDANIHELKNGDLEDIYDVLFEAVLEKMEREIPYKDGFYCEHFHHSCEMFKNHACMPFKKYNYWRNYASQLLDE